MENSQADTSVHYEVLRQMAGEYKMEALDVLQMGEEEFNELQKSAPILFRYVRALRPVFEGKKAVPKWVHDLYNTHQAVKKYLDNFARIAKGIHQLPAQGWYFSIEFIDAFSYEDPVQLMASDLSLFQAEAIETFHRQAARIQAKLLEGHPRRDRQINSIFRLHEAGEYIASIPLALAQADGMCSHHFTIDCKGKAVPVGFFATLPGKPGASPQKLSKSFNLPETSIFNVLCNQLAALDKSSSVVLESNTLRLSDLNRNAIMHGESVDYGTEVNSVKAILLLDFIEDLHLVNQTINSNPKSATKS